ncbi:MAG: T9SS C-terminal target domain-containing protein [Bacteroidetes bacterium]|nr:MAG: T9SS C-terminal target domain-containing protein [Bacteroidota bacterium]REK00968.1 MAG: T9SS C-terminal target domain-containing protein [Bacteroidota bacterium]REK34571.1 MAG: T9SS C-terminal target domain-containing protein [Bacteroidota bacterium]REK51830.1 MAG: T9SS C-terminal target domain-containing protein [Bacteroidota bacterium]
MRNLLVFCIFFLFPAFIFAQSPVHAVWEDNQNNDYYYVRIDPTSGIKTNVQVIPGMTAFVAGRKTAYDTDLNRYYFTGLSGAQQYLYTIDAVNGSVISGIAFNENVVGMEYNCNDSAIYGFKISGSVYEIVRLDPATGATISISSPVNITAYVGESFALDRRQGLYCFIGFSGSNKRLLAYDIHSGQQMYNHPFADNLAGIQYSCPDSAIVGLWESGGQYKLEKIDVINGTHSTIGVVNGVTPGITAESSCVTSTGVYIYRGFDSLNNISIISVKVSDGSTVSVVSTSDNAKGFREIVCCEENNSTLGIEMNNFSDISLYPNPCHNQLIIESSLMFSEIRIYSLLQGEIISQEASDFNDYRISINTEELRSGIYLTRMIDKAGNTHTSRFIKN